MHACRLAVARCGGRSTCVVRGRFPMVAESSAHFSTQDTPPIPPPAVVLALKRVSALRQKCADIAEILDDVGALPPDLATELNDLKEYPDGNNNGLVMADAEKEAARLRALSDDLAGVLREAEIMAEHGEHKC